MEGMIGCLGADLAVCRTCGHLMVFTGGQGVRELTDEKDKKNG